MNRWLLIRTLFILLPLLCVPPYAYALDPVVPAQIVSITEAPDSVGYVTWSGSEIINAEVGRWDTPYPYPDTGQYAPGLQPTGRSTLHIDIDVNDGAYVTFRYLFQTYDAGIWDWYDLYMETPDGKVDIVTKLGKPGSQYGTYWKSAWISASQDLSKWRNQRVRFVISVMQDGWGDQSQGQVKGFRADTCPVPPLTPIDDFGQEAVEFENMSEPRWVVDGRFNLHTELACLEDEVSAASGNTAPISAYRSTGYQQHLREVWDTWMQIEVNLNPECAVLREEVKTENDNHGLGFRPSVNSLHEYGLAFDLAIGGLDDIDIDIAAAPCGLYRFDPIGDPNHFNRP